MTGNPELLRELANMVDDVLSSFDAPRCKIDDLPADGEGISLQMGMTPERLSRDIGGTGGRYGIDFTIIAQSSKAVIAIQWLNAASSAFGDIDELATGETIVGFSATTPSIIARDPNGQVRYGLSIGFDVYS